MLHVSMAAKKKSPAKKAMNKTAFVKSLPASMPGAEVVKRAKAAGLKISVNYVYSIRARSNPKGKRKAKGAPTAAAPPAKRGPGRPPGIAAAVNERGAGGLEAEIERIVERKVSEILRARLGTLFSG